MVIAPNVLAFQLVALKNDEDSFHAFAAAAGDHCDLSFFRVQACSHLQRCVALLGCLSCVRCPAAAHCTTEKDVCPCLHASSIKSERLQIKWCPPRVLKLTTWVNASNRIPRALVVFVFQLIWTFSKHGAASLLNSFERRLEILNHFRANRVSQQSSFQLSSIGPCYHVHMR